MTPEREPMTEGKTDRSREPTLQVTIRPKTRLRGLKPEYVIKRFPAGIGRHPSNDLEIPFESVSRYHARLELIEGRPRLVDLRSSNGTFINGERVEQAPVSEGDGVAFGGFEFTVSLQALDALGGEEGEQTTESSVQFLSKDETLQTVCHTDVSDETSGVTSLAEEVTDPSTFKRATERLRCFYRLHELLNAAADEKDLLRGGLDLLFEVLPIERGVVLCRDRQEPSTFHPVVIRTRTGEQAEKIGISKKILHRCLRERVAVLTREEAREERFKAAEPVGGGPMRSVMCAPLISAQYVFGFIHVDITGAHRSFSREDLTFLTNIGTEIAVHLHNIRMIQDRIATERMVAIGQTITGMAHNIKNILVLSEGGLEMMEKRLHSKNYDELEETWSVVRRGMDRINRLVKDMLDYSRSRTVEKRRVNVNEMLGDLRETFAEELRKRQLEFECELDERIPRLMLDAEGLEKALCNLIVNAMEACPPATGRVILRSRLQEDGDLTIEVIDNGNGIPEEVQPRIFAPFFSTKGPKGSGLGLPMTRKVIEDMGGTIDLDSTPGEGTRFVIELNVNPSDMKLKTNAK